MTTNPTTPTIYFDGSCRPNPGMMGCGIVIYSNGKSEIIHIPDMGQGTNNVAEWSGLLLAVDFARKRGFKEVIIKGDSNLVIQQALGRWKTNGEEFIALKREFQELSKGLQITLCHVPRDDNPAGKVLENFLKKGNASL